MSDPRNTHLTKAEESSSAEVKQLKSKFITSQTANDSGIKMLIFKPEHVAQTDEKNEPDLHNNEGIIQEFEVEPSLINEGRVTYLESEIQELKIRIQLREDWMKDLEKRLAEYTSENACKESKITQQNAQLEEQNEMLIKRNEKIEFLEKQLSEVWTAADNAGDALKQATEDIESSLHQMEEVKTSELETEIQVKDKLIQQLQIKMEELKNKVQTSNDLDKKCTALGANISILKREINKKDQAYRRLEEENKQLNVKMKQFKSRESEQVVKLHASLKEKVMELAKASEKIQVLENTINILKDQQVMVYSLCRFQFLTFHLTNL